MRTIFTPKAVNDLDEIWGFIAADNLDSGRQDDRGDSGRHRCSGTSAGK